VKSNSDVKQDKPFASYEVHLRDQAAIQILSGMVMQRIPSDAPMQASYAKLALQMADAFMEAR
jgi:hypothetical protein